MITPFARATSIRQKLVRMAMLSVSVALLLSALGATAYEVLSFRSRTRQEVTFLADVVGANSAAALALHDVKAASEALATLHSDPRIVSAALLDRDGRSVAAFGASQDLGQVSARTEVTRLWLTRPIRHDGQRIGTIRVEADSSGVWPRLGRYVLLTALVAVGSFLTAYLLSIRLQRVISGPIRELAETATAISIQRDYSLRVETSAEDEVGLLIDRFNEMLSQIEIRDMALERGREGLENRVRERTRELRHEVAERTRAEESLAKQAQALARSNTDLQQFAYVASHDLQEPLRMVASYLQLITRRYRGRLDSDADDFIDFAVDGARRMQALIQDLLSYSRVGTQSNRLELVETARIFDKAVGNLKVAIEESAAVVTRGQLPSVWADPTQMTQLFQNLIGNAIKFRGKGAPSVEVSAVGEGEGWRFSIRDNGIGIESRYADRIFVIFQRLHSREEYGGTGIGLAVCKKIVERHRGRIWMESTPGEGSVFHFTIGKTFEDARSDKSEAKPGVEAA